MRLTKIVFRGHVDGIFGESVSSLSTEPGPTVRTVAGIEVTPVGVVITKLDGGGRCWIPSEHCSSGQLAEEPAAAAPAQPRQKAR